MVCPAGDSPELFVYLGNRELSGPVIASATPLEQDRDGRVAHAMR